MKIQLSPEMVADIDSVKAQLDYELKKYDSRRASLEQERAEMQTREGQLEVEIPALKIAALQDGTAAEKYHAALTRKALIAERLDEVQRELVSLKMPTLAFAVPTLQEIARHWNCEASLAFVKATREFFSNGARAMEAFNMTNASSSLRWLVNFAYTLNFSPVNGPAARDLLLILRRAQEGQILLGMDPIRPAPAAVETAAVIQS